MDGYIGEIRAFGFSFVPKGWLLCNGQRVSISSYTALYSIIANYYGDSDMKTYFTLPNLQGLCLIGATGTSSFAQPGLTDGSETVTLNNNQLPAHNHAMFADLHTGKESELETNMPGPAVFLSNPRATNSAGKASVVFAYSDVLPTSTPNPILLAAKGGSQAHENRMPYLPMQYCICYDGEYPIRP